MNFNSIVGHSSIIEHLQNSIVNNRVNHAYIFNGIKGIGKATIAKVFAKTLNCEVGGKDPCCTCVSCKTFDNDNNPDIIYVTHKKKDITVDDIRTQILQTIAVKPYRNRYKIYIIPDADKMNIQAQNALLKTLEEPPEYGILLLLCENYNKFLVTILSRCIMFKLHPLPYDMVAEYIAKITELSKEQASLFSIYAQGSIGKALELAQSEEFRDIRDTAVDTVINIENADMIELYRIIDKLKDEKQSLDTILEIMYLVYRDALVIKQTGDTAFVIQKDKLNVTNEICNRTTAEQLLKRCSAINETRNNINHYGNTQLLLETLFFKIKER